MSTVRWIGGAAKTTEVHTYLFGGTWEADDLIRVVIGSKKIDFVAGSTTIATIIDDLVTAWNELSSSDFPEFAEITASRSSSTLVLTMDEDGVPFIATLTPLESGGGAADAQTIEGAGTATTGTVSTAATGPNFWSDARNWSGGAVPVNGDTVYLENSSDDIKYGLAQSAVTLAVLNLMPSFSGNLGLPKTNSEGTDYPEYRADYLSIGSTLIFSEDGTGNGSSLVKINVGSVACTLTVRNTGFPTDTTVPALIWKGTDSGNVVNVLRGSVGIAPYGGETATVATLRVGYITSVEGDAQVRCGAGVTLATLEQSGGDVELNNTVTTVKKTGGNLNIEGTGTVTTLTNDLGTVSYRSSGTITTLNVGNNGLVDFTADTRAKTVTNCNVYGNGIILSPNRSVTFTNGINVLHRGDTGGLSNLSLGDNILIEVTSL